MATYKKPTLGTGSNDINIQASKSNKEQQSDIVDATGKPIRQLSKEEKNALYNRIKKKYDAVRSMAQGTQANHTVTSIDRKTGKAK